MWLCKWRVQSVAMQIVIQCTPLIGTRDSRDTALHFFHFQTMATPTSMHVNARYRWLHRKQLQRSITHNFHSQTVVDSFFCTPNMHLYYNRIIHWNAFMWFAVDYFARLACILPQSTLTRYATRQMNAFETRPHSSVRFEWTRLNALWSAAVQFAILIRHACGHIK